MRESAARVEPLAVPLDRFKTADSGFAEGLSALKAGASYRSFGAPLAVAALYFAAAKLGGYLAFPAAPVSALWAPNAIVFATLLLAPRSRWWAFLAAIVPVHFYAQFPVYPFAQVIVQYLMNVGLALIGALAIGKFCPLPRQFDQVRTSVVLVVCGGILAPLATSLMLAGAFVAIGITNEFWLTVIARTITNAFAVIALVPLIVHSVERLRRGRKEVSLARAAEAVALALCTTAICIAVFVLPLEPHERSPLWLYAPLPLLAWGVMRFGVGGACGLALIVGAVSTWGVLNGSGPFAVRDPVQNALSVVSFQVMAGAALLLFAALRNEWRQAVEALRRSELRFRSIFEDNIIPTLIWRDHFRISEANDAFLRLTGYTPADIEGGVLRVDELTARTRDAGATPARQADLFERFTSTDNELTLRDGRRVPVVIRHSQFAGESGGVIYALDLSAFRRAEAQRLCAENLHAAVLGSLHDQIAILDSAGTVIEMNESWRRAAQSDSPARFDRVVAGESYLQACERAAGDGNRAAREHLDALRAVLDGAAMHRHLEYSGTSAQEPSWIEVSVERLRRPEGGAVITRTDVTARKQAELDARNQRQQLTHLGRVAVLGQLSGAFAHELNQPLTSILGNAEAALKMLARGTDETAEVKEILRDIVHDNERASQVIQRLRALLDKGDIQRRAVDLNTAVGEVLDLARSELIARNVQVSASYDRFAPPVMADRVQLQQVVLNLLMNACEAMASVPVAERRVSISTRFVADRTSVDVAVTDGGGGIPPSDLERIFQPFVTTKAHGMGLGLAICRSVAESHGARLWAENGDTSGAVFHLTVPVEGVLA
ncbi:MAG TPA: ATP-binding protein [Steroidobacteraceae bacterium]|nr:ATP-binding protein [Steroidobacteraceae bacterium]